MKKQTILTAALLAIGAVWYLSDSKRKQKAQKMALNGVQSFWEMIYKLQGK